MHEQPEVPEVDINPLIRGDNQTIAVDALVVTPTLASAQPSA
jgi:hypothetical protein